MLTRLIAIGAALGIAAPGMAAELHAESAAGARRSGASVAAYVSLRLDSGRHEARPVWGLRLAAVHDYRNAAAPNARVIRSEALDLKLTGPAPALFLGGRPVTGREARVLNAGEGGGGRLDAVMIAAAGVLTVAAAVVIGTSF